MDVQAPLASQVGKFALQEARKQEAFNAGLGFLQQAFAFNPLMDLRGVTVYGQRLGDDVGVVILGRVLVSQDKILPAPPGQRDVQVHRVRQAHAAPVERRA